MGTASGRPNALVIGVGNEYRHDDGVGLVIARRLQEQLHLSGLASAAPNARVAILEQSGEGAALLEAWKGHCPVFLVDAIDSGAAPGTIQRLDAHAGQVPSRLFHCSTHAFNVAEAIELAWALNQLPPRLLLYGVEGNDYRAGLGLSPEVEAAASEVVKQLLDELRLSPGQLTGRK